MQSTIARRIQLLGDAVETNSNVRHCVGEAKLCIEAGYHGHPFPGTSVPDTQALWVEAAGKWMNRAGQHAFGFALPQGW